MPVVTVRDKDLEFHQLEVKETGQTLLKVIQDAGLDIASNCGGGGWCSSCAVEVLEGYIGDNPGCALSAMDDEDKQTMSDNGLDIQKTVLSCQCNVKGDCKVGLPYL
jgi:ferredoxin